MGSIPAGGSDFFSEHYFNFLVVLVVSISRAGIGGDIGYFWVAQKNGSIHGELKRKRPQETTRLYKRGHLVSELTMYCL